jgi:hypothetical protein
MTVLRQTVADAFLRWIPWLLNHRSRMNLSAPGVITTSQAAIPASTTLNLVTLRLESAVALSDNGVLCVFSGVPIHVLPISINSILCGSYI